jgi:hypothetical protein
LQQLGASPGPRRRFAMHSRKRPAATLRSQVASMTAPLPCVTQGDLAPTAEYTSLGFRSNPWAIEQCIQPTCFTRTYVCLQSTDTALTNMVRHNDSTLPSVGEV